MCVFQILSITLPALLCFCFYFWCQKKQSKDKSTNEILTEIMRNQHEITMYEKRKEKEKALEESLKKHFEEKFLKEMQEIKDEFKGDKQ